MTEELKTLLGWAALQQDKIFSTCVPGHHFSDNKFHASLCHNSYMISVNNQGTGPHPFTATQGKLLISKADTGKLTGGCVYYYLLL